MSLFNFDPNQLLTFFAVLIRYSVLFSVLPFVGDRVVPVPVKVLLALAVSFALFPALVNSGSVNPRDAGVWASTSGGIVSTVALEVLFGLALGYTTRLIFEGIAVGANFIGNFMGFAAASTYDPHQESQTEIIAQLHTTMAMLVFLALDGHHLMLRASLDSYRIVGLGRTSFNSTFNNRLIQMTGEVLKFGIQLAAPIAVSLFSVNVVFGILGKAMPQLNILVLSFAVCALIGFFVMLIGFSEFQSMVVGHFAKIYDWMQAVILALGEGR